MPSKTEKQRRLIYAVRNKYKSKYKTPKKWKWVWGDEWLKVKESFIKSFEEFKIFESQELYKEVEDYNVEKIVDISFDNYDKIAIILDEAVQDDIVSFETSKVCFENDDDFKVVEYIKILNKVKDIFINIYEMKDEWFLVGITYDYEENKKYLCDQFYGLEYLIEELIYT